MKKFLSLILIGIFFNTFALAKTNLTNDSQQVFANCLPQQLQLTPSESPVLYRELEKIINLRALDKPVISMKDVLNFTTDAVSDLFTFNFANHKDVLTGKGISHNFTAESWRAYQEYLKKSKLVDEVTKNRIVLTTGLSNTPFILDADKVEGVYTFKIQIPLTLLYSSPKKLVIQQLSVTATVKRVPVEQNANGIIISNLIFSE